MKNPVKRRLAVLPARSGSKRIHKKNIRPFLGKPIIQYTIEYARASNLFDKIHVSTDSAEIASIALKSGIANDFFRPDNLSDDHTGLFAVLKHTFEEYQRRNEIFDEIWLLMPCAPLITSQDLINASKIFVEQTPLIAVSPMPCPPQWSYVKNEDGIMKLIDPKSYKLRSQDFTQYYYDAGAFAIFSASQMCNSTFCGNSITPYELPQHRAIDIDTMEDWEVAENMYKSINIS